MSDLPVTDDHDLSFDDVTDAIIWNIDHVELTAVGIDIGSATSQVMFSRVLLRRKGESYSSRFEVVEREILFRSRVFLTPYVSGEQIDVTQLKKFIDSTYAAASLTMDDVDAGAVILTGVALERSNARNIAELFADSGGKFVCASAGHNLEALLAAHGSGAVEMSATTGATVLNIDIGGGTTKLALVEHGKVLATMAVSGGGRLLAWDGDGRIERIERAGEEAAASVGVQVEQGLYISDHDRTRVAAALADRIFSAALGTADAAYVLAGSLPPTPRPTVIVVSGGVAQFLAEDDTSINDRATDDYGDLGLPLAAAVRTRLRNLEAAVHVCASPIRATVVGASQYSVQLSGNTVYVSPDVNMPLHNLPAVVLPVATEPPDAAVIEQDVSDAVTRLDLDLRQDAIAVAVQWNGEPSYANLQRIAHGLAAAHNHSVRRDSCLVLVFGNDVAQSIGSVIEEEFDVAGGLAVVDGVDLRELDFLDVGKPILPANVVPVIVKSLLFPAATVSKLPS